MLKAGCYLKLRDSWWTQLPAAGRITVQKEEMYMDVKRSIGMITAIVVIIFWIAVIAAFIYLMILVIKALRKYVNSKEVREEKTVIRKSLGELLKENRLRCKMTQEFVAEALGVSRQAVSKWENGTADPSTSNLLALSKIYGIEAEELLRSVGSELKQEKSVRKEEP